MRLYQALNLISLICLLCFVLVCQLKPTGKKVKITLYFKGK